MPPKRYFDDERSAKPGTISQELRKALDLHDDKLPMWIYKMRVLGYPPGWLQRADISNTSLQLFDGISEPTIKKKDEEAVYNPECLIEFPGFNAPVPKGVKDHCEIFGMPPLQAHQQLNFCKLYIPPPKPVPYKRLKLSRQSISSSPSTSNNNDVNKSSDPKNTNGGDDDIVIIEPEDSLNDCNNGKKDDEKEEGEASSDEDRSDIIALADKTQSTLDDSVQIISSTKSQIKEPNESLTESIEVIPLEESLIDKTKDSLSDAVEMDTSKDKQEKDDLKKDEASLPKEGDKSEIGSPMPLEEAKSGDKTPKSPKNLKLIAMGCPTPANVDHKKPPLENFAVGMGELIYFENLPTSTGAFQKMRSVIHNVRKKLSE